MICQREFSSLVSTCFKVNSLRRSASSREKVELVAIRRRRFPRLFNLQFLSFAEMVVAGFKDQDRLDEPPTLTSGRS